MSRSITAALFICLLCALAEAEVRLPGIFGDNMVIQREKSIPVWGWASPGATITVSFGGQTKTTKSDSKGRWRLNLKPLKANSKGQAFKVDGDGELILNNVLIGEVWICSGQSNMEMTVRDCLNAAKEIVGAKYPAIRHITIPRNEQPMPVRDLSAAADWKVCSPNTVAGFTAAGYFFARELYKKLRVPIGLISTSWGGSRIEPWIPMSGLEAVPELNALFQKAKRSPRKGHLEPTMLYNGMIAPLVPFAIRGVIWYQGESNGNEHVSYLHKMDALITGWRKVWRANDFPFYYVQLANYKRSTNDPKGGDGWAGVREAQLQALSIPQTGMACAIDIGEAGGIHPRNKQDIGKRLALWALKYDYGKNVVPSGPLFKKYKVECNKIRIHFDHVGSGLMVGRKSGLAPAARDAHGKLQRFAIAGKDKQWHWADAVIEGDTVVVSSSQVPTPVAVRYAYSMNPKGANLYSKEGLPASPFRTDR